MNYTQLQLLKNEIHMYLNDNGSSTPETIQTTSKQFLNPTRMSISTIYT